MTQKKLMFYTAKYRDLAESVCAGGGFEMGEIENTLFPDGERYMRILTSVDGRDAFLLGGAVTDTDTLELFDLACGMVKYGARRLSVVVPYFGYSTMDRAVHHGEIVTAKTRARLLSSIPEAAYGNRIFLVDLHTEGLPHYFEGGLRPVHVYASAITTRAARDLGGDDFVMACTDAGRAKWVESLANDLGVSAAFVFKRRLDGEHTRITGISADVAGRRVVIYDDMIRTGGSLLQAAGAYRDAGAVGVAAVATHGVLPGDALERMRKTGLLDRIVVTDSHPQAVALAAAQDADAPFLEVRSLADTLIDALRRSP